MVLSSRELIVIAEIPDMWWYITMRNARWATTICKLPAKQDKNRLNHSQCTSIVDKQPYTRPRPSPEWPWRCSDRYVPHRLESPPTTTTVGFVKTYQSSPQKHRLHSNTGDARKRRTKLYKNRADANDMQCVVVLIGCDEQWRINVETKQKNHLVTNQNVPVALGKMMWENCRNNGTIITLNQRRNNYRPQFLSRHIPEQIKPLPIIIERCNTTEFFWVGTRCHSTRWSSWSLCANILYPSASTPPRCVQTFCDPYWSSVPLIHMIQSAHDSVRGRAVIKRLLVAILQSWCFTENVREVKEFRGVLNLFCSEATQVCHDLRVEELKEQLEAEEDDGDRQEKKVEIEKEKRVKEGAPWMEWRWLWMRSELETWCHHEVWNKDARAISVHVRHASVELRVQMCQRRHWCLAWWTACCSRCSCCCLCWCCSSSHTCSQSCIP